MSNETEIARLERILTMLQAKGNEGGYLARQTACDWIHEIEDKINMLKRVGPKKSTSQCGWGYNDFF